MLVLRSFYDHIYVFSVNNVLSILTVTSSNC